MSATLLLSLGLALAGTDTTPIECTACAGWNEPQPPFRLHGDSWYVGTRGLSSVLIATPEGLVLIDGGLPQSAPLIAANIESLGFRMDQVRYLLNSHEHFDHAGGLAALQRLSGAPVLATADGARALRRGGRPRRRRHVAGGQRDRGQRPAVRRVLQDHPQRLNAACAQSALAEPPFHPTPSAPPPGCVPGPLWERVSRSVAQKAERRWDNGLSAIRTVGQIRPRLSGWCV